MTFIHGWHRCTLDSPLSGFLQIEQFLRSRDYCGDGRDVKQPNSVSVIEQVLEVTGFPGSGGVLPLRSDDCSCRVGRALGCSVSYFIILNILYNRTLVQENLDKRDNL
jgi:hypothetical protein